MARVILDSKDLARVDQEFAVESKVWEVLREGSRSVDESDFVGVREVRVNVMTGFQSKPYQRGADNPRSQVSVTKQTLRLEQEDWMGYDLDALDQSENASYNVAEIVETHRRQVSIPAKDTRAVDKLVEYSEMEVEEAVTVENSLEVFDAAEQYMIDNEIVGPYVLFASSEYYRTLKNNEKVTKTFTVNEVSINGINRKVGMLDNEIPIITVPKARLQLFDGKHINFILVPLRVAAPIDKVNDVTLIPASSDRDGYRDTIKGLDYYDLIVFENARKAIYVSYEVATPTP